MATYTRGLRYAAACSLLLSPLLMSVAAADPLPFGPSLLESEFLLNYTNFNHGSYGACPKTVLEYQSSLRLQQEQQPDEWMRKHYKRMVNETRFQLGDKILKMSPPEAQNLVLVESASTAVNSILRSLDWKQGDILLLFSMAFKMVQHTADWLSKVYGIQIVYVPIPFPIPHTNVFTDALQASLTNLTNTNAIARLRMVVLDQMVSVPAVKEPIAVLAAMVKDHQPDCFVLVDGAHAMGQIPFEEGEAFYTNLDAYLSNGHKWLFSAKGSAILWVNSTRVTDTFPEPTVIASLNDVSTGISLSERYAYVAARDYTAWLTMDAAIKFRAHQLGGEERIYKYCRQLAIQAKHYLMDLWKTPSNVLIPDEMEEFMVHVQLPAEIDSVDRGLALQDWLLEHHNTYVRNIYDADSGIFYTRLSSQVYLEMNDFKVLGHRVLDFCAGIASENANVAPCDKNSPEAESCRSTTA